MITNTISSNDLFLKNVWSVQLFLPKEELQTNDEFKLTKLEKLVYETSREHYFKQFRSKCKLHRFGKH